jgi:hypothetical protein
MKKIITIVIALVALFGVRTAQAWGTWGHHAVAFIAEKHLTPEAKAKCQQYLQFSLPHYSSWQDYWRNSPPFQEITHWHMNRVNKDFVTVGTKGNVSRDAVTQINRIVKEMEKGKYKEMSDSLVAVNLKLLIHMVGDMHCPCHMAYSKDFLQQRGVKGVSIFVKGKKYDYHKFWDAAPQIMHPKWRADDYLKACDTYSPKQIKKISKGNVYKWSMDNAKREVVMFDFWERHEELTKMSKERRERINDLMYQQLAYAGYRLAATLNKLFAK